MIRYNGIELDTKARSIKHGEHVKQCRADDRLFDKLAYFILGGGVSLEMVFHQFHGGDPDGGPITGPSAYGVKLNQWQKSFLSSMALEWRSYVIAGVTFYEIVPETLAAPPQRFAYARSRGSIGARDIPWVRREKKVA